MIYVQRGARNAYKYIERGGSDERRHIVLCCGSHRIDLWRTKEKEREQVYQLLGR